MRKFLSTFVRVFKKPKIRFKTIRKNTLGSYATKSIWDGIVNKMTLSGKHYGKNLKFDCNRYFLVKFFLTVDGLEPFTFPFFCPVGVAADDSADVKLICLRFGNFNRPLLRFSSTSDSLPGINYDENTLFQILCDSELKRRYRMALECGTTMTGISQLHIRGFRLLEYYIIKWIFH